MRFSVFHTECDVKTTHWKILSTISVLRNYIILISTPTL